MQLLKAMWAQDKFGGVGLDPDVTKIPKCIRDVLWEPGKYTVGDWILTFNKRIIDTTHDIACMYKPNYAFYEAHGNIGLNALRETIKYINKIAPEVPVILDYKRADIGNTNIGSVQAGFDDFGADAVTVNPYFGREALQPFLDRRDKGIIILCRTSNPGAGEFQDLPVIVDFDLKETKPVYQIVAEKVSDYWNQNGNCLLVVGATAPEELKKVRNAVGDMPILIPGIGKQGGDLALALEAGLDSNMEGVIINSSREILYASDKDDYAEAARAKLLELHEAIRKFRVDARASA